MITVVVAAKDRLADGVVKLSLAATDGTPLPPWTPGAHVDLELGNGLVRQYSLCGSPSALERYEVAVLREAAGRGGSAYVHDVLAVGDRLVLGGPRNNFSLVDAPSYLFVAGGIGITPLRPMMATVAAAGAPWRLLYGGRTRSSMAFLPELTGPEVSVSPQDEFGLLDLPGILGGVDRSTAVYCCGPEPLLAAVEAQCAASGLDLHVERFRAVAPAEAEIEVPFEVELARSGRSVKVAPGCSILEAVEEAGVAVLSSCREGTCGTCETGVLDGMPEHRDSILTPAERENADFMMICVSRSKSPRLVLDL